MHEVRVSCPVGVEYDPFSDTYVDTYSVKTYVVPEDQRPQFVTHKRAIISGNIIEVMYYQKGVAYGYKSKNNRGKNKTTNSKRSDNINRAKNNLRRVINANVNDYSKFITFTFKENLQDVGKAKIYFKRFIERFKRKYKIKLKYVYVVEFQRRGAIHFHSIFFNMPYIPSSELAEVWKHGFIKINKIDNVDNVGAYVVKYMSKDLIDDRLNGHDLYGRSRGLKVSIILTDEKKILALQDKYFDHCVYSKTYSSDYKGNITYMQYNLNRNVLR